MNDFSPLGLAFATGVLLGAFFFGGLWWTVRKGVASSRPELWFFGSMLVRTSITLAGFYLIADEYWERWLLCLCGFILARLAARWLTGWSRRNHSGLEQEGSYAP